MSEIIDGEAMEVPPSPEQAIYAKLVDDAYAMSTSDFAGKTAKEREVILFVLLRELTGEFRLLNNEVREVKDRAAELLSPEGLSQTAEKFLGGGGMGGLLGMLGGAGGKGMFG